jgi:hypothetical protein
MSNLLSIIKTSVINSNSIIAFTTTGNENWKVWDRFLTIEGKPAYHIGNVCDTCEFFFERLEGANRSISPAEISEIFESGLQSLDSSLLDKIKLILPAGEYAAMLLNVAPQKVSLGSDNDYFTNEQAKLWGIDGFWGLPHSPRVEYYRTQTKKFDDYKQLFEFVVPMYPAGWLSDDAVREYESQISEGRKPTALALSILDVKQPATWEDGIDEIEIKEHWSLTHYLLDGHHKVYAASNAGKPITMLSFLAVKQSLATEENIAKLLDIL